jgi:hypothetical protein
VLARGVESIKSTTFPEAKKAPAFPGLQVCSLVSLRDRSPRRSDFYSKAQITQMVVQKMQVVVQKKQDQIVLELCYVSNRGPMGSGCCKSRGTRVHETRL